MSNNILGYRRDDDTKRLISSDYAALRFGGAGGGQEKVKLVQSAQLTYGHQVTPRFEAGSSQLYWVTGQAQGRITLGRAVSSGGFFAGVDPQQAAGGSLVGFNLSLDDFTAGNAGGQVSATGKSSLQFKGGVIANLTATVTTGSLDVSEGVEIAFSEMLK